MPCPEWGVRVTSLLLNCGLLRTQFGQIMNPSVLTHGSRDSIAPSALHFQPTCIPTSRRRAADSRRSTPPPRSGPLRGAPVRTWEGSSVTSTRRTQGRESGRRCSPRRCPHTVGEPLRLGGARHQPIISDPLLQFPPPLRQMPIQIADPQPVVVEIIQTRVGERRVEAA